MQTHSPGTAIAMSRTGFLFLSAGFGARFHFCADTTTSVGVGITPSAGVPLPPVITPHHSQIASTKQLTGKWKQKGPLRPLFFSMPQSCGEKHKLHDR